MDFIDLIENVKISVKTSRLQTLYGIRQYDQFLMQKVEGGQIIKDWKAVKLEGLLHNGLKAVATWYYDATDETIELLHGNSEVKSLPCSTSVPPKKLSLAGILKELLAERSLISPHLFIIETSLLFEDPNNPTAKDRELLRLLEKSSRKLPKEITIFLKTDNKRNVPETLINSSFCKSVSISSTHRDERQTFCCIRGKKLAEHLDVELDTLATLISAVTDNWTLIQVGQLINMSHDYCEQISDIESLANSMMTGVTNSPWLGKTLRQSYATLGKSLNHRVKGQPAAVEAVLKQLRQSIMGLTSVTQNTVSTAPKGVFFFAGPTGTGKTELTKALAESIYGSETNLIRFDCGELQESHAVSRLIGAPPGYVGYEQGGELTDAVAQKPASIILFDEIEKAHPRLFDILLSVLDDGRLSNGQGQTTFFSDSLIVFTSNLGMFDLDDVGDRKLKYSYKTEYNELQSGIRESIANEFISRLGRPELLGRLGGKDNIIVSDYLRDIKGVIRKFIKNIAFDLQRLHKITLNVNENIIEKMANHLQHDNELISLGGRGIGQYVKQILLEPLVTFMEPFVIGKCESGTKVESIIVSLVNEEVTFRY